MDFDFTWLLLALPMAFALGWLASRLDLRQWRIDNRQAPKAYFKGLNYLLANQQDQAIDAFIEAVQHDADTSELHFALGQLFRRRGDYHGAVRVHEHLLARGDLRRADQERARYALAQDFLTAGLLDRAEAALLQLQGTAYEQQANLALLGVYERTHDWARATEVARRMQPAMPPDFAVRIAHGLCEQALHLRAKGDATAALALIEQAQASAPQAPRPLIERAALLHAEGQSSQARDILLRLAHDKPEVLPITALTLAQAALASGETGAAHACLAAASAQAPSLDVTAALNALASTPAQAEAERAEHLRRVPSLVMAREWLKDQPLSDATMHTPLDAALARAAQPLSRYPCRVCGFSSTSHFWQCPGCQSWDSFPYRRLEELA